MHSSATLLTYSRPKKQNNIAAHTKIPLSLFYYIYMKNNKELHVSHVASSD